MRKINECSWHVALERAKLRNRIHLASSEACFGTYWRYKYIKTRLSCELETSNVNCITMWFITVICEDLNPHLRFSNWNIFTSWSKCIIDDNQIICPLAIYFEVLDRRPKDVLSKNQVFCSLYHLVIPNSCPGKYLKLIGA